MLACHKGFFAESYGGRALAGQQAFLMQGNEDMARGLAEDGCVAVVAERWNPEGRAQR
jgi:hypothetical protein